LNGCSVLFAGLVVAKTTEKPSGVKLISLSLPPNWRVSFNAKAGITTERGE
jgi:hypothetical protein